MTPKKVWNRKDVQKPLFRLLFFLLFFSIVLVGSVAAVSIEISNFRSYDSVDVSERYYTVTVLVKDTVDATVIEQGIVELGLSKDSSTPFLSIVVQEQPCEATFPWNVHAYYKVSGLLVGQDSATFTLRGMSVPDGTYFPVITHATGCFNAGGDAKEPYGWGKRITANAVVFGGSTGNLNDQCDNPYTALQYIKGSGDLACVEAVCDNAASTSSTARCVKKAICVDGAQQWLTCGDGSSVVTASCVGGAWVYENPVCDVVGGECSDGQQKTKQCDDGSSVVTKTCVNKHWADTGQACVPNKGNKALWFVVGGIVVLFFFGRPLLRVVGVRI